MAERDFSEITDAFNAWDPSSTDKLDPAQLRIAKAAFAGGYASAVIKYCGTASEETARADANFKSYERLKSVLSDTGDALKRRDVQVTDLTEELRAAKEAIGAARDKIVSLISAIHSTNFDDATEVWLARLAGEALAAIDERRSE